MKTVLQLHVILLAVRHIGRGKCFIESSGKPPTLDNSNYPQQDTREQPCQLAWAGEGVISSVSL